MASVAPMAPTGSDEELDLLGGNTKTPKRPNSAKHWCFTWNNYPSDWHTNFINCGSNGSMFECFVIQEEVGEQGTPHLQGVVRCFKKHRWAEFHLPKSIHWEVCKNWTASIQYCSKRETRRAGTQPFTKGVTLPEEIRLINPTYPWEQDILSILQSEPDDRKIYWIFEPIGGAGKSQFAKYITHTFGAIPIGGRATDILYAVAKYPSKIYYYDMPRSHSRNHVSYETLEMVKNGVFLSTKYDCATVVRNAPHIFIFANEPPAIDKLSADRWVIKEIRSLYLLDYNPNSLSVGPSQDGEVVPPKVN